MKNYKGYVKKIHDLEDDLIQCLEFINWKEYARNDSTLFVKPNFTFPYHKKGITTSPNFLRSLLGILKDRVDRVFLGESDGGNHSFSANDAFSGHNMYEICKDLGVELINLSKSNSTFVSEIIQKKRVKIQLPTFLMNEIDCFVSVPVLKVHVMTGVTLGIKNLWGCYPDTMRCLHHQNLDNKLSLFTKLLDPKFVIIDGTWALDGHGPMFGNAKKTDLVVATNNSVVSDSLGASLMGIPLKKAKHILVAEKEELGTTKLDEIDINTDWHQFSMNFKINKTLIDHASWILFNYDLMAKLVMDSPLTPLIYNIAGTLRTSEEKKLSHEIKKYNQVNN